MPEYWSNLFDFTDHIIRTHLPMRYWGTYEWEYSFNPSDPNSEVTLSAWTSYGEYKVDYVLTGFEGSQVRKVIVNDPCLKRETVEKISLN